jgi:hypothetical protein
VAGAGSRHEDLWFEGPRVLIRQFEAADFDVTGVCFNVLAPLRRFASNKPSRESQARFSFKRGNDGWWSRAPTKHKTKCHPTEEISRHHETIGQLSIGGSNVFPALASFSLDGRMNGCAFVSTYGNQGLPHCRSAYLLCAIVNAIPHAG